MTGECDVTGQEILPLLEDEQEEEENEEAEPSLKHRKLRKSHRTSRYHSRRARDQSLSERSSCHLRRTRELPWRVESPRQLWDLNEEEEEDSHIKRKKRRRQKSRKYQTGEYLTEREEEEHMSLSHKRRKLKAGTRPGQGKGVSVPSACSAHAFSGRDGVPVLLPESCLRTQAPGVMDACSALQGLSPVPLYYHYN